MSQQARRRTIGVLVVLLIALLPLAVLSTRDPSGAAAAKPPAQSHGPRRTRPPAATPAPTAAPTAGGSPTLPPSPGAPAVLVGAGDIASCSSSDDEATAALLDTIAGTVFTLGDNVYDNGTASEFDQCYGPSWGRPAIKARTRPVPGNHEYNTANATGYYGYFGSAAGDPARGYYAYDHGSWRVYALNSDCAAIGGCGAGSPQEQWLRADLAANPRACTLAMWHHPLFSSGDHGNSTATQALYQALYDANAELVVAGHDHDYERFAPQTATGALDTSRGIVEFVVGTGGRSHYAFETIRANSLVRNSDTYGVLRLLLYPDAYQFLFVPISGQTFSDGGSGTCH